MPQTVVTPSAARYHRRALGLTQTGLAQGAGVSTSYVKQFESERLRPSSDFLQKVADFFVSKGIKAEKLGTEYSTSTEIDTSARARPGRMHGMATVPHVDERQCFFIAKDLPASLVEEFLARWDKNEDRIAELFKQPVSSGLFAKFGQESEARIAEVFGLLAESFVLFRLLTGWNVLEDGKAVKADTIGSVFVAQYADVLKKKRELLKGSGAKQVTLPAPDGDIIDIDYEEVSQ